MLKKFSIFFAGGGGGWGEGGGNCPPLATVMSDLHIAHEDDWGRISSFRDRPQGAEEPNSTFVNIKMLDLFRSACHTLPDLFVYATLKAAGILLRLA